MTREEYIQKYKLLAVEVTEGTGLYPSVMLAQAIVESGNGNSELASKYNNHFGIKADSSWTGEKVNLKTREVISGQDVVIGDYFRVYDKVEDSYRDRVKFLQDNPRYTNAGVFNSATPYDQLQALQRAGYATDPQYAEIINSILTKYQLTTLDMIKLNAKKALSKIQDNPVIAGIIVLLFIVLIYLLIKK